MNEHQTRPMLIAGETAMIDHGIYDLVEWLNSFDSILTFYSCEGTAGTRYSPYVFFACLDSEELKQVIPAVMVEQPNGDVWKYADLSVDLHNGLLRYEIKFPDSETLQLWKSRVTLPNKEQRLEPTKSHP